MPEWGAIVKVTHQIGGHVPWRVLDELTSLPLGWEEPSGEQGTAPLSPQEVSPR